MSVLKNLRRLSGMEFYKNALKIRMDINNWILHNFGEKIQVRDIKVYSNKITSYDKNRIYEILDPYGLKEDKAFALCIPDWFYDGEREDLRSLCKNLIEHVTSANNIYVYTESEYDRRRILQDNAINDCYLIYSELYFLRNYIDFDLNRLEDILESLDKEIELLQGWKKSNSELWTKKKRNEGLRL